MSSISSRGTRTCGRRVCFAPLLLALTFCVVCPRAVSYLCLTLMFHIRSEVSQNSKLMSADQSQMKLQSKAKMPFEESYHQCVVLADGHTLLMFPGSLGDRSQIHRYDAQSDSWDMCGRTLGDSMNHCVGIVCENGFVVFCCRLELFAVRD